MNKIGENTGNRGKGRPPGSPNKVSTMLKDAILKAATESASSGYSSEQSCSGKEC
jgi:hypothetical protein